MRQCHGVTDRQSDTKRRNTIALHMRRAIRHVEFFGEAKDHYHECWLGLAVTAMVTQRSYFTSNSVSTEMGDCTA